MNKTLTRLALSGLLTTTSLLATACPPGPPTPRPTTTTTSTPTTTTTSTTTTSTTTSTTTTVPAPAKEDWRIGTTRITVAQSRDCQSRIRGTCVSGDSTDEAYVQNIGFRVTVGVANSARTWVATGREQAAAIPEPDEVVADGNALFPVEFTELTPLDVADVGGDGRALEVFGTYTWASERGAGANDGAATTVATALQDALNGTVAASTLPSRLPLVFGGVLDDVKSAFGIVGVQASIALNDGVLGGGLYLGFAAKGNLASIIDDSIAAAGPQTFAVAGDLPDVQRSGFFTLGRGTSFTQQLFIGSECGGTQCGQHLYDFAVAKA